MRSVPDLLGRFGPLPRTTTAFGTVATVGIPPWQGPLGTSPFRYSIDNGRPNWFAFGGRTVVTSALYTTSTTAHVLTFMRPLNFAMITTAVAAGGTTITIDRDPGVYSTNYRYPSPMNSNASGYGQGTARLSDANVIATNDYVAFQLVDGTWIFDTITVAALVLTPGTAIPNVTGGGIAAGSPLFWFGASGDSDPATGLAHPATLTIASTNRINHFDDDLLGFAHALHPGDPLIVHSDNATATGTWQGISGYYAKC